MRRWLAEPTPPPWQRSTPRASAAGPQSPAAAAYDPSGPFDAAAQASLTGVTAAGRELMLLLLRANVPNAELLTAKTDREYALIAQKHGVALPLHLSFLPHLQPPHSQSEKELVQKAHEEQEASMVEGTAAIKERPPRRTRLLLTDVKKATSFAFKKETPPPAPPPVVKATGSPPSAEAEEDYTGKGSAMKERAPSVRRKPRGRKRGAKGKGGGGEDLTPRSGAPAPALRRSLSNKLSTLLAPSRAQPSSPAV